MDNLKNSPRLHLPDCLRLTAMALMIFYHFSYDLVFFRYLYFDIMTEPFWWFLPRLIVFLFLFTVGWSLHLVHAKKIHWPKFLKRFFKIASAAVCISLVTYFLFPDRWIYFGTLHCIALSSFGTLLVLKHPRLSLFLGLTLLISSMLGYNIPWIKLPHAAMDHVELFPWIGASFLGNAMAYFYPKLTTLQRFEHLRFFQTPTWEFGQKISEHSLFIYLVHQPILFGIFYTINLVFSRFHIPN